MVVDWAEDDVKAMRALSGEFSAAARMAGMRSWVK